MMTSFSNLTGIARNLTGPQRDALVTLCLAPRGGAARVNGNVFYALQKLGLVAYAQRPAACKDRFARYATLTPQGTVVGGILDLTFG